MAIDNPLVKRLAEALPTRPTLASAEVIALMKEVASTKRLDAAVILVKALVFNLDNSTRLELPSTGMLIPVIPILKDNFGDLATPILFTEALKSDQPWFRNRAAAAIRIISSRATVETLVANSSLKTNRRPSARAFLVALNTRAVDLFLTSRLDVERERLAEALRALQEKRRQQKQK